MAPKLKPSDKIKASDKVPIMFRVTKEKHDILFRAAEKAGLSMNEAVMQIVDDWLGSGNKSADRRGADVKKRKGA